MCLKWSNSKAESPIDAMIAQPAKKIKKGTTILLPDEVWIRIVPYVDSETLPALSAPARRLAIKISTLLALVP